MKINAVSVHATQRSLIAAEIVGLGAVFLAGVVGARPLWVPLAIGAVTALILCVVRIRDAVGWKWLWRAARNIARRKPRTLTVGGAPAAQEPIAVDVPQGGSHTVDSQALAQAVREVLAGKEIRSAYQRADITVSDPAVQGREGPPNLGDIGVFTDRDVLALGDAQAYEGGKIVSVEDLDTDNPTFLGWFRPPVPGVPADVEDTDGNQVGVLIDGHTVITMVSVWGRPYIPTVLYAERAETPNVLPLSIIAEHMRRVGLAVDVDVIVEGERTTGDAYAVQYDRNIGARACAGRRTTTLVIRLDTRDLETVPGLIPRTTTAQAAIAATRRIVFALQQSGCRAQILEASRMREVAVAAVGGPDIAAEGIDVGWRELRQRGRGYVTSFYFSAEDVTAESLDAVWAYSADPTKALTHVTLILALRRQPETVTVSAVVRVVSPQPLPVAPAPHLNRATGWQWEALQRTMIGADRLTELPCVPINAGLDSAVVVGASGVMLGRTTNREGLLLMPLSDPAAPTRIVLRTDNDAEVRKLIRRAAAVGERVAVYDPQRRWAMTASSSHIWNTSDASLQPPWPPTMVLHNGNLNPYRGAWSTVSVEPADAAQSGGGRHAASQSADADIYIDAVNDQIQVGTHRFRTPLAPLAFPNERAFLN